MFVALHYDLFSMTVSYLCDYCHILK